MNCKTLTLTQKLFATLVCILMFTSFAAKAQNEAGLYGNWDFVSCDFEMYDNAELSGNPIVSHSYTSNGDPVRPLPTEMIDYLKPIVGIAFRHFAIEGDAIVGVPINTQMENLQQDFSLGFPYIVERQWKKNIEEGVVVFSTPQAKSVNIRFSYEDTPRGVRDLMLTYEYPFGKENITCRARMSYTSR